MKKLVAFILAVSSLAAVEIELKDGETFNGDVICDLKGKLVIKQGIETISIFKKSIQRIDDVEVAGSRKFMLDESKLLKEKNEIIYSNISRDSLTIRFRDSNTWEILGEKTIAPEKAESFFVPDGSYIETVRYWRDSGEYYLTGAPFTITTDCNSFERYDIELRGYDGDNIPQLKGPKREYERK